MKITIELEGKNPAELQAQLLLAAGVPEGIYTCRSRLGLVKEIRDLYRAARNRQTEPSLIELRNAIWKHVV